MENLKQFKSHEQSIIQDLINEDIDKYYVPDSTIPLDGEPHYDGRITFDFKHIDFELYERFDEDDELYTHIIITDVEDFNPTKLLDKHNIKYSKSKQSNSFYININGTEHRVSDHKRPSIVQGDAVYEHTYPNEHICEDDLDIYRTIKKLIGG